MAIRQEELGPQGATVYHFPLERVRAPRRAEVRRHRVALGAATVILAAAMLLATGPEGISSAGPKTAKRVVVVEPGDTLWGIAATSAPSGTDLRAYIAELSELNELDAPIHPGMRLKLPR